jgi:hypothetical protein
LETKIQEQDAWEEIGKELNRPVELADFTKEREGE